MKRYAVLTIVLLSVLAFAIPPALAAPAAQGDNTPAITAFETTSTSVHRDALANRTARVPVSWETANRPFIANLVFDQVLPDGSAINVELPRPIPWVASSAQGMAAPILPEGDVDEIVLRVQMVNMLTRSVYDEATITLPIVTEGTSGGAIGDRAVITAFTTPTTAVLRAQLTAGDARVPVSWQAANRPSTANLYFEQVLPDGSAINVELPREDPWVASAGDGVAAPVLPEENAQSVLLRVRLIDLLNGRLYDQRYISLSVVDSDTLPPEITAFSTSAQSVNAYQLATRAARVPVSWATQNRPDDSNLVFEQVFSDGSAVNVELPRANPWVPSSGNGVAAPVLEFSATEITLRVRLIDLGDESTIDEATLTLPITGSTQTVPSYVVDPSMCYAAPFAEDQGLAVSSTVVVPNAAPETGLRVLASPYGGTVLGTLARDSVATVLEGPFCYRLNVATNNQSAFRLWRIRNTQLGLEGWVNEFVTSLDGTAYHLVPAPEGVTAEMEEATAEPEATEAVEDVGQGGAGEETSLSIDALSVTPETVRPGGDLTLEWETTGASFVGVNMLSGPGGQVVAPVVTPGQGPLNGSIDFTVPNDAAGAVAFAVVASDEEGNQVSEEISATIGGCPFGSTLTGECPTSQNEMDAALQPFEGGYMLWLGGSQSIYVLSGADGTYAQYPDTYTEGETITIDETPPADRVAPVRGFAKVWADEAGISDLLGWGLAEEQGYTAIVEEYPIEGEGTALVVSLPDGRVLHLEDTWRVE